MNTGKPFFSKRRIFVILLLLIVTAWGLDAIFPSSPARRPLNNPDSLRMSAIMGTLRRIAEIFLDGAGLYKDNTMDTKLTPEEERIIVHKGTEAPFSGKYNKHYEKGTYTCRRCSAPLFESSSKFKSDCGWPSFDDQIGPSVKQLPDADGRRKEIICAKCDAHLGHIFLGERFTPKNARYCVNSISMDFIPAQNKQANTAIFASGCFWGTEYHLQQAPGVISTTAGYTGGKLDNPTYQQVCTDRTGHAEAVEVVFDPSKTDFEKLAKLYFETHDFTQLNRQGPDVGKQYRSAIFYMNQQQRQVAERLIQQLKKKGFVVKTQLVTAAKFWPAEKYHQDYYKKAGKTPYCHTYKKIF